MSAFEQLVKRRAFMPPPPDNPASGWIFGNHDGVPNPKGTGPFRKSKRSLGLPTHTRPTPGSAYRSHNPTRN